MPDIPELPLFSAVKFDAASEIPLYEQLYESLREEILANRLEAGVRLPSSRDLSDQLGLARNTVVTAYQQLIAEGYLEARVGAGTFVTEAIPEHLNSYYVGDSEQIAGDLRDRLKSDRGQLLARSLTPPQNTGGRLGTAFAVGQPDLNEFPRERWARLSSRMAREIESERWGYPSPLGLKALREAVCRHLQAARGVRCTADQIVITSGTQEGLYLAALVLIDPGEEVWVENPGYLGARRALKAAGANLKAVNVDEAGLDVARGVHLAPNAKLAYITPSHQFPLGQTMSLARRIELLEWAENSGSWILEDDYDSEFRFRGRPIPALQSMDTHFRVIYLGSFSKILVPGLRLGFMVLPPDLVRAFVAARLAVSLVPPALSQATMSEFMRSGEFGKHLRRMRVLYAKKSDLLRKTINEGLSLEPPVGRVEGGMQLTLPLPRSMDDWGIQQKLAEKGLRSVPLSAYDMNPNPRRGLVLGFAAPPLGAIVPAVRQLTEVLQPFLH